MFPRDTLKYEPMLPLWPNCSPICVKDSINNTTKQENEMEIVECNTDEYKEVRQNHGSFYTHMKEKNTNKKARALGPKV